MKKSIVIRNLKISMIIGGIVDSIMVIIFIIPDIRIFAFRENPEYHTGQYEWGMQFIGSLGVAWTLVLFWASKRPFERKDILLFTVFPLMFGAYSSTVYGFMKEVISLQFFILITIITFVHCPYFLYIWIKSKKIKHTSE